MLPRKDLVSATPDEPGRRSAVGETLAQVDLLYAVPRHVMAHGGKARVVTANMVEQPLQILASRGCVAAPGSAAQSGPGLLESKA